MKRDIFLLIFLCIFCFLFFSKSNRIQQRNHVLYEVLSKENFGPLDSEKLLYINVGIDHIPQELIELFEELTGARVIVDIFDSNEILEAKLLAGGAKYDLVFPSAWPNFSRQLKANIYKKIDKSKINLAIFDESIMKKLAEYDNGNNFAIPYIFGISGIGINENTLAAIPNNIPKDSLAIIFDPGYAEKINKYRISLYESPDELFPVVLSYLGLDPETESEADTIKAAEHIKKIRKYVTKFTSYGFEDLASGNACVSTGTASDVARVNIDNNKPNIKFYFPKEGGAFWVDVAAIPAGATHINNVYAFLKFLFHPKVISHITNKTSFANAVVGSSKFINPKILNNKNIYPDESIRKKCYIEKPMPANISNLRTRLLTKIKSLKEDNNSPRGLFPDEN